MAKQTFTTGQVLTAAQMTALQQTAMLGGAANAKVASYVLVAADAGDAITMSNASPTTITVNTGLFAEGDIVTIINLGAGACTITAGTATVTTSGSLVLATNQGGVLRFTSASAAIFFQFATPASGDIEGVTAGVGISGGGTSGTVTITNSMATEIAAKGDLIVGTGSQTFDNLSVGTNGHTLVADSSTATGLKWAAPSSGALTLISATSFSSSSAHSVNDVFSATYDNYLILITPTAMSQNLYVAMRLRVSGSDNSSNNYGWSVVENSSSSSTPNGNYSNGLISSWYLANGDGANFVNGYIEMIVRSPYLTARTGYNSRVASNQSTGSYQNHGGGMLSVDTSYTGFTLIATAGNMTGNVKVYGYANS